MIPGKAGRAITTLLLALLAYAVAAGLPFNPARSETAGKNCLSALARATDEAIVCEHPATLTEGERADLKRLTRNFLEDAHCLIAINVARRVVEEALAASDIVFEAPPQPVTCEVKTRNGIIPISGTFAPRVVFKNGAAVEASPGLANLEGVSKYVAWPVVAYINNAPRIRGAMLTVTNTYRARMKERRAEAGH